MPRPPRASQGGAVYHVLNRANARMRIFGNDEAYSSFEDLLSQAIERHGTRLLAYCLMPNHWHLVLWPRKGGELSTFMRWLTVTHTNRWHARHGSAGTGHLDQGRFKSFPVQSDNHLFTVCRYVERNALRAGLCCRAEEWLWGSAHPEAADLLHAWPEPKPRNWLRLVNEPQTQSEVEALRQCVNRGQPFGAKQWVTRIIKRFGLASTVRPRGRPRNKGS